MEELAGKAPRLKASQMKSSRKKETFASMMVCHRRHQKVSVAVDQKHGDL
jgi:hypothetical protein